MADISATVTTNGLGALSGIGEERPTTSRVWHGYGPMHCQSPPTHRVRLDFLQCQFAPVRIRDQPHPHPAGLFFRPAEAHDGVMTSARPPEDEDDIDEEASRPTRPAVVARVLMLAAAAVCLLFGIWHWLAP